MSTPVFFAFTLGGLLLVLLAVYGSIKLAGL